MLKRLLLAACLTTACATSASIPACGVSEADRAWIDGALAAWRLSAREITGIGEVRDFQAIFFDDDCVLTSADAFHGGAGADIAWRATPHRGAVRLPNAEEIPAGVTSFAAEGESGAFFVMSTPSVWQTGGVRNEELGLETMMVAVFLHEGAHISQSSTYGRRITALAEANNLPDDFNDDSIQERFGENTEFAASVQHETDLFFAAAASKDDAEAERLAREARDLMRTRQARWYVGADAYLAEAEDIWLTFEGSGQWVGYQWLVHPAGGGVDAEVVMPNFARRSRWWSQNEGLGLALALDRLSRLDWKRQAFGEGALTLAAMLDDALAIAPAPGGD